MAIVTGDILVKFSVVAAAGDTTAGTAPTSLGDQLSTTAITDAALHNVFDVITGDENVASDVEYRCLFYHNNHASLTWQTPFLWITAEVAGGAVTALAVDNFAASPKGQASAQADVIANENTAPTGAGAFSAPTTKATGIAIGDIIFAKCRAIWIRRSAANTVALDSDGVTIRMEGDTSA